MKRLHLEGEKYGTIEVLSFEKVDETGRSWWRCRCECGNEYFASSATLRKAKTCKRCASKKMIPSGTRFGKLTIIKPCYDSQNRQAYECVCDCGNQRRYTSAALRRGKAKTCGHCQINTFRKNGAEAIGITSQGARFRFDMELWNVVTSRNWQKTKKGYIVSGKGAARVCLHRLVMNATDNQMIDHINRDKSDCRRANLRVATNAQNSANSAAYKNNKNTGHKNVYVRGTRFRVGIRYNGKLRYYGSFESLSEAVEVANAKRRELFGAFAYYDNLNNDAS